MGRPLKIKKSATTDIGYPGFDALTNPVYPNTFAATEFVGIVGGDDSVDTTQYPTVKIRVKLPGYSEADGWIIRQKAARRYLVGVDVRGETVTGVCTLANLADGALTDNTMTATVFGDDSSLTRLSRMTNRWALDYAGNRYLVNFFTNDETIIKSGTKDTMVTVVAVEKNT